MIWTVRDEVWLAAVARAWTPTLTDGRRYAAGLVPVADAFLAWRWWVGRPAATSLLSGLLAVLTVRRLRRSGPLREGSDS